MIARYADCSIMWSRRHYQRNPRTRRQANHISYVETTSIVHSYSSKHHTQNGPQTTWFGYNEEGGNLPIALVFILSSGNWTKAPGSPNWPILRQQSLVMVIIWSCFSGFEYCVPESPRNKLYRNISVIRIKAYSTQIHTATKAINRKFVIEIGWYGAKGGSNFDLTFVFIYSILKSLRKKHTKLNMLSNVKWL